MHRSPRLLGAGVHTAAPGKDYPLHAHTSWELVYYVRGRITCPVGDETYDATPGTVLLTPPNTWHAEQSRTGYANRFLQVDAAGNHPWPKRCYDDADHTLRRVFDALVRESAPPADPAGSEELRAILLSELDLRLRRAATPPPTPAEQLVAQAEQLFEERFAAGPRVADIAVDLGISPSGLRAAFARVRGTSPQAALQAVRLRHALAHIRNSTLPLQAIAELTGYHSVSHLSRQVKAATGTSPGALRTTEPRP
ncbi:AraC family transcriptional regulator [Kribbella sp.]|uniref:helix-turn-helix domain-containing protein n=1 Tax=Kribbella sp. TaxID=1871183 RepID=UPI002D6D998D|nr:AraC family transcriptional regulator [Kribbella sp.]HZX01390.1 AraC family transcriptional regulator [Kribbella sp.]